jgi:hypothetical protein
VRDFGVRPAAPCHAGKITLGRMMIASAATVTWSSAHTDFGPRSSELPGRVGS